MGFNARYYAQAENEIKQRRQANLRRLETRHEEIERRFPEYKRLRLVMASTGARIASAVISKENVKEKMAKIEAEYSDARVKTENILFNANYPKGYLNPVYSCSKCFDTGIENGVRCECFKDAVKRLAADGINSKSPLTLTGFESFDIDLYPDEKEPVSGKNIRGLMGQYLEYCLDYSKNFFLPNSGLLFIGKHGLGKTHLSLAIAGKVLEAGYSAVYGSAPDLFRRIEDEHFGRKEGDTADSLQEADLLVLDDIGAEHKSDFYTSVFYNLLNSRMNGGLPLIISTNLSVKELEERYGERVTSRLITMKIMNFYGNDIRQIKRKIR